MTSTLYYKTKINVFQCFLYYTIHEQTYCSELRNILISLKKEFIQVYV